MAKRELQAIDYVTKDFEGFRQLMLEQIPIIAPDWTDTSEGDFGIVLMELLCYGLDVLSFYQDKAVNESFLPTAKTRKAVINICKLLGYNLKQQQPSKFLVIFKKLEEFKDRPITIYAGTIVGTDPSLGASIPFEVDTTLIIPSGAIGDEKDANGNYMYATTVTQGKTVRDELGIGDGEAFQKFKLNYNNVLLDTITLWTEENGVVKDWTRVEDFLTSTATDKHYLAFSNEANQAYIEFGDGYSGLRLKKNVPLFASYRVGGGSQGNVGVKSICAFLEEEIVGIDEIINPEPPISYGCNVEDIEHAKLLAPRLFKTNNRAVTPEDFEAISVNYNGVAKAKCIETFNANGDVLVYIANLGYTETSSSFKEELKQVLDVKKLINANVIIKDAEYKKFDIEVIVKTYPEYANGDVKLLAEGTLQKLLDIKNFDFGEELNRAFIIKELMMMDEILDVSVKTPSENITATSTQILRLGEIKVEVIGGMN